MPVQLNAILTIYILSDPEAVGRQLLTSSSNVQYLPQRLSDSFARSLSWRLQEFNRHLFMAGQATSNVILLALSQVTPLMRDHR